MVATVNSWAAPGTPATVLSTELNSLASGTTATSGLGTEYNNTTGLYLYADCLLLLGADATAAAGYPFISLYLVPLSDATTYPNPPASTGLIPENYRVGNFVAVPSTTFRRATLRGIVLPPFKFKMGLMNVLGAAFNATGNTVVIYPFNEQSL